MNRKERQIDTHHKNHQSRLHRMAGLGILAGTILLVLLLCLAAYAATNIWPNLGAGMVDLARSVVGDKLVSQVEDLVLNTEDKLKQIQFNLMETTPVAPWQVTPPALSNLPDTPTPIDTASAGLHISTVATNTPAPSPTPAGWRLANVPALGAIPGEGQWTAYLRSEDGSVVAYRTFLQPDPQRAYVSVAVVAFDLKATRLHFVLGYQEPQSTIYVSRPARIPASNMLPGKILAAFNGGFKAQHGHFGVMVNGTTLIPPRDGYGTVAIHDDGTVALGAWGKDITSSPDLAAWRQNGPLIIQYGQVNPLTTINDPKVWGFTTDGGVATGRSALGISSDGSVLYYAVGFNLTMASLARAVQDAGAYQAIQLDINNYYTHFEAFSVGSNNQITATPLLDQMKGPGDHRYLSINKRDFFYVTPK